ncbi:PrpF protein [Talaromyces proteolyticus]|uniref:PrpF protein n=1 Tax=Talaromyces proteolyticus TaxID=1131652 RepID=A0AAD4KTE6_9EURO|nr:PrpF protein [Talaromyces proteolyticus]KAH8698903.1 PrpF protein [Talaromyces proteolyticus]
MSADQIGIPAVLMRGGSSKAMFFKEEDVPPPGLLRDRVLKRIMGTPDPIQIDGMGGTRIVTSKVAIIKTSDRDDADVDYSFGQVSITEDSIRLRGNCGNISAGVGPFAIDEGLIRKPFRVGQTTAPGLLTREVRIYQTAIKKILIAHVPIDPKSGKSLSKGNFAIAAVPGTGAPILMDFRNTIGGFHDKGPLPTGHVTDVIQISGAIVSVTIMDVATLTTFVRASDLGVWDLESRQADDITSDKELLQRCREVRGKAAQLLGMCDDWEQVDEQSLGIPSVVMVAAPPVGHSEGHITSRFILNNMCHDSMAGTIATCTAACSRIDGSIVRQVAGPGGLESDEFNICHPLGVMPVKVEAAVEGRWSATISLNAPEFKVLAFVRTSRRIMEGKVFIPDYIWPNGII